MDQRATAGQLRASAVAAKINKKYGDGTIILGSQLKDLEVPRIPTGSLSLDVALGGGWPANQWNEVIGDESHGKTALILKTIAENQRLDKEWFAVWVAAEEFVPEWAEKLGVDLSRTHIVETNEMEKAYGIVIEYLDSRAVDAVVIDSLAALVPSEEAEKAMEEFTVGLGARITGKFFRKQGKASKRSLVEDDRPVTGFIINQYRVDVGVRYGDNRTTPGGKGKNFFYFTRVEVRRDDWIAEGDTRVGQTIKMRAIKNKSAPPQRVAVVDFYFQDSGSFHAGDMDRMKEVVGLAISLGIIERKGAYYHFGGEKWQGREALVSQLREDLNLQESVEQEVMKIALHRPTENGQAKYRRAKPKDNRHAGTGKPRIVRRRPK